MSDSVQPIQGQQTQNMQGAHHHHNGARFQAAVEAYMQQNPGVSREQAIEAVKAQFQSMHQMHEMQEQQGAPSIFQQMIQQENQSQPPQQ